MKTIEETKYRKVKRPRIGDLYDLLYPQGGNRNLLCRRRGEIVKLGKGPGGSFFTGQAFNGGPIRSYSKNKTVKPTFLRKR
tara:strand:+ start:89 stop:331 length:243 start_codon:yes stop_codon:yes gene_type:complete